MKSIGISSSDLRNPQLAPEISARLAAVGTALALAILLGFFVGAQWRVWLVLFGVIGALGLVAIGMKQRAWMLIVLGWPLTGKVAILPLPFAVRDLLVIAAGCAYVWYRVLTVRRERQKFLPIDLLLMINVAYVFLTFFLNPVGLRALGSEMIGGRAYFNIAMAVVAHWILLRLPDSLKWVSRIPYFILIAAAFLAGLDLFIRYLPQTAPVVYRFYTGFDPTPFFVQAIITYEYGPRIERFLGLRDFGLYGVVLLCSYYSPITIFDPRRGRFYFLLLCIACVLLAGYRSSLLVTAVSIPVGAWLYGRWRGVAMLSVLCALLLGMLAMGQGRFYNLPLPVQRALAFLPGKWDEVVVLDTKSSSEWRFRLWDDIVKQRLIRNWWFGDGFGAKAEDFYKMGWKSGSYNDFVIATGAYHNGPLTAIRYVGVVGLILLYALSVAAAVYSYRAVKQLRGTKLFPVAMFMAIQLIWGPISFALIFGAYDSYLPDLIFQIAIVRLLMRMTPQARAEAEAEAARRKPARAIVSPVALPA